MSTRQRRPRHPENGSILVMTALSLVMLLGVTALAVDASFMYDYRNRMAAAADAAAVAGARAVKAGYAAPYITRFAQNQAYLNGFQDGSNGITVTINNGPTSGPFAGNAAYVEAIISRPTPTFFARVLSRSSMTVSARAVAGAGPVPLPNIIAMCDSCKGVEVTSTIQITTSSGVIDYSTGSPSFVLNSTSGTLMSCPGACPGIYISSTEADTTNCTIPRAYCSPTSKVQYNYPRASTWQGRDPLNGPAAPSCSPCTVFASAVKCDPICDSNGTIVLQPGDYQDKLTIAAPAGVAVYMNGGVYQFSGAHGLIVSAGHLYSCGAGPTLPAECTNTGGVSLVNTEATNHGSISISTDITLRARNQMLIYQCVTLPNCTANTQKIVIGSGSAVDISGIIYAPTSEISFTGGSTGTTTNTASFIVDKFGIGGNGAGIVFNPVSLTTGGPVVLSE